MATDLHLKPNDIRARDPNVLQWQASNPQQNVWVSASAGTGKTKVLTDRVLRLLLPRENGAGGSAPHRILCLTYTKAAASEMLLRINKELSKWAIIDDDALYVALQQLTGTTPSAEMAQAARKLFAEVMDTPGGLKIMTIHAFCQSMLGRFPLEAGISAHMEVMDERTAKEMILDALRASVAAQTLPAYERLSIEVANTTLIKLLQQLIADSDQLEDFFAAHPTAAQQKQTLQQLYHAPDKTASVCLDDFITDLSTQPLKRFADALSRGAKSDAARADVLYSWLAGDEKAATYPAFKALFLTQKQEIRAKPTKDTCRDWPEALEFQAAIGAQILALEDQLKAIDQVELTLQLLHMAAEILHRYQAAKQARGVLDYNDLLQCSVKLLQREKTSPSWVLYKLDGGLDHLLVDEAQDTNPAQWDIISLLIGEFYASDAARDHAPRSLFVVGDEKQSIYRFQGASLEDFQHMRGFLRDLAVNSRARWQTISLQMSFRSTRSVLGFVDAAFHPLFMKRDIGLEEDDILHHESWRRRAAGSVTLWPLLNTAEKEKREKWQVPVEITRTIGAKAQLAEKIAQQISHWIKSKRILESRGTPVRAGDIMVLVRSRSDFVENLIRALKTHRIPVNGADRLLLTHHIAVQDLLALARFALQPDDDLSVAEILKSPFIGLDDAALEDLSHTRTQSLWQMMQQNPQYQDAVTWLRAVQQNATQAPFVFFSHILYRPCPQDPRSGLRALRGRLGEDCVDILDEFLNNCAAYEQRNAPNLQVFLRDISENPPEIKREFDSREDAVRIMTVHGAKGLQAPIIFLPDTIRTTSAVQNKLPRLMMPRRSHAGAPLWSPRKDSDCAAYNQYLQVIAAQESAEYKRLFYVAATRAEDELIICGAAPAHGICDDSWYFYAERAFEILSQEPSSATYTTQRTADFDPAQILKIFSHPQIESPQHKDSAAQEHNAAAPLPMWILSPPPAEPEPPRPLRPSRPSDDESVIISPRGDAAQTRFRRGNLIHTLLQFLPHLSDAARIETGTKFLEIHASDINAAARKDLLHETLRVMNDPRFAAVFSEDAQAEVSLSGHLPSGRLISGQVDRLCVRGDEVLIIDYKTNRPPPQNAADIPAQYKNQMQAYKEALCQIYPDKRIRCALLWTYGPYLMEVDV